AEPYPHRLWIEPEHVTDGDEGEGPGGLVTREPRPGLSAEARGRGELADIHERGAQDGGAQAQGGRQGPQRGGAPDIPVRRIDGRGGRDGNTPLSAVAPRRRRHRQ